MQVPGSLGQRAQLDYTGILLKSDFEPEDIPYGASAGISGL